MKIGKQDRSQEGEFLSHLLAGLLFLFITLSNQTTPVDAQDRRSAKQNTELSSKPAPLPHLQRGVAVKAHYQTYADRMARFYDKLRARIAREAPDLLTKLPKSPPQPIPYGYQILPILIPTKPSTNPYPRVTSVQYSWPITERMINGGRRKLGKLEQQLDTIMAQRRSSQYSQHDQIIKQYSKLVTNQRLIDRHIKYNSFWQQEIHNDKVRYDRQTALHDAVVELQEIQELLKHSSIPEQTKELEARERAIHLFITTHRESEPPASFLALLHPKAHLWILQVPLFTDIQDSEFLQGCEKAIEKRWHVVDGDDEFRVEVLFTTINPVDLYDPNPPPPHATHIDPHAHTARFPATGGVLTTGAKSTHAMPRRSIALGPQNLNTNTIAHEFGHVLGFGDRYFRGYRDLGDDGYEILEVVPDYDDIMAAPGMGHVLRSHFDRILAGLHSTTPAGPPSRP
jgi:hypothetical protein